MKKIYKKIADKLNVSQESVAVGISDMIDRENIRLADEDDRTGVGDVVRDLIELFYCNAVDEQLQSDGD